jgi:phage replication-related protein YjqB (UPF0714/DUF867 family)
MICHDTYKSYSQLAKHMTKDVDYSILAMQRHSPVTVVAPHGGGIEPGTSEVAKALAGRTISLYIFEGLKGKGNRRLHITSTRFDEPQCLDLIHRTGIVITIHACDNRGSTVYIGGRHKELKEDILDALKEAGFKGIDDSTHHGGINPYNLCNRGRTRSGVQIEF